MFNLSEPIIRFIRVVAGQGLGAVITAVLSNYSAIPELQSGTGAMIAILIGSGLTALDKYLRDKGIYQPSVESGLR